ncbi:MAG TPA: hypothetical protein DCZ93_12765 [Elusimicrobia bacterium]|nr:hypothetical protein [Elusimicrobiota bacterium]
MRPPANSGCCTVSIETAISFSAPNNAGISGIPEMAELGRRLVLAAIPAALILGKYPVNAIFAVWSAACAARRVCRRALLFFSASSR